MVKLVKLTFALSVLYCLTSFGLLGLMVQTYKLVGISGMRR